MTHRGSFVPVKLKVCNSLILYDSSWLKVSEVLSGIWNIFICDPNLSLGEPQVSLSGSIENITYRIQTLWQAFSNCIIVNMYFCNARKIYWFQTKSMDQHFEIYWSDLSDLSHVWKFIRCFGDFSALSVKRRNEINSMVFRFIKTIEKMQNLFRKSNLLKIKSCI